VEPLNGSSLLQGRSSRAAHHSANLPELAQRKMRHGHRVVEALNNTESEHSGVSVIPSLFR